MCNATDAVARGNEKGITIDRVHTMHTITLKATRDEQSEQDPRNYQQRN